MGGAVRGTAVGRAGARQAGDRPRVERTRPAKAVAEGRGHDRHRDRDLAGSLLSD